MFKVVINTDQIHDRVIVKSTIRNLEDINNDELLKLILDEYYKWHTSQIYNFDIKNKNIKNNNCEIEVVESIESKTKKHHITMLDNMKQICIKKKIEELSGPYNLNWVLDIHPNIHTPLNEDGMIYNLSNNNNNLQGHYKLNRTYCPIFGGTFYFEVNVLKLERGNASIGVFSYGHKKFYSNHNSYLGYTGSWSYFSNGKSYHEGHSSKCGDTYKANDTIGVLVDEKTRTIEFFHNTKPLGALYHNVDFPVFPAVSSECDSSFRLNIPNKFEVKKIPHLQQHAKNIIKTLDTMDADIKRIKQKILALKKIEPINELFIWDQLFTIDDHIINYPIETIFENSILTTLREPIYCRTLNKINDGINFFEIDIKDLKNSSTIRCPMIIGVITNNFNKDLRLVQNRYWGYGIDGTICISGSLQGSGQIYGVGDKIGICVDLLNNVIEFFHNGIIQYSKIGVLISEHDKYLQFFVQTCSQCQIEIIPSTLDTYIEYKSYDPTIVDKWIEGRNIMMISDVIIQILQQDVPIINNDNNSNSHSDNDNDGHNNNNNNNNNDSHSDSDNNDNDNHNDNNTNDNDTKLSDPIYAITSKKYTNGRRYMELTGLNVKGNFRVGYANDNKGKNSQDSHKIVNSIYGHTFQFDEETPIVQIGILIDFDNAQIESYIDRMKINETKYDGFGSHTMIFIINSMDSESYGNFEINCLAEKEVSDTMIIYN
jgi:hypothetical protein